MSDWTGICIDGPKRGEMITADQRVFYAPEPLNLAAALIENEDVPVAAVHPFATYTGVRFGFMHRVYNVWTSQPPAEIDHHTVLLALIDSPESQRALMT